MENKEQIFTSEKKPFFTLKRLWISLLLVVFVALSFLCGYITGYFKQNDSARLVNEIVRIIESNLEDAEGQEADAIASSLVRSLLPNDAYAKYYSPAEYSELKSQRDGDYQGIGISINQQKKVVKVLWNSPAEQAGVQVGDEIVKAKINGQGQVVFETLDQTAEFLKSAPNDSQIILWVLRNGQELEITINKSVYPVSYVRYYDSQKTLTFNGEKLTATENEGGKSALDDKTAFIILTQFEGEAGEQIGEAMAYMKERGRTKLILDLRENGGGSVDVLKKVAKYLIRNDGKNSNCIAWVDDGEKLSEMVVKGNEYNNEIEEIVVLASQNTASASEILIGAMLNDANHGGKFSIKNLVLTYNTQRENFSTYGKGIMQTIYPLSNGGALKMTTAKLFWPDKATCIHDKGITQQIQENCFYEDYLAEERAIALVSD